MPERYGRGTREQRESFFDRWRQGGEGVDSYARGLESKESQADDTRVAGADETRHRLEVYAWKKCEVFNKCFLASMGIFLRLLYCVENIYRE